MTRETNWEFSRRPINSENKLGRLVNDNPYQAPSSTPRDCVEANYSCPQCGEVCENGFIQALGNITWYPKMTSFKLSRAEKLSSKTLPLETRLQATRCRDCGKITVHTSPHQENRD